MAPRTFFLPFLSLCLIAHLHGTMSAEPLYHICSSTPTNHTTYTSFHHSFRPRLHTLAAKPSTPALCRGDVMRQDCKTCVENATIEISHLCPGKEEAIVYNCLTGTLETSCMSCPRKHSSHSFLATGEVEVSEEKIYGLAQCSRDLSDGECTACLDDVIKDIPTYCYGKRGGRVSTEGVVMLGARFTHSMAHWK
ncbi:hypothetical protein AMTRI_Chr02g216350 [Amborella trichopoda]